MKQYKILWFNSFNPKSKFLSDDVFTDLRELNNYVRDMRQKYPNIVHRIIEVNQ